MWGPAESLSAADGTLIGLMLRTVLQWWLVEGEENSEQPSNQSNRSIMGVAFSLTLRCYQVPFERISGSPTGDCMRGKKRGKPHHREACRVIFALGLAPVRLSASCADQFPKTTSPNYHITGLGALDQSIRPVSSDLIVVSVDQVGLMKVRWGNMGT